MTAIGEDVLLFGVGVEVDEHLNAILVLHYILFYCVDLLASVWPGHSPAAVEVIACDVASRIP